jgi:hypothetical protein
LLQRGPFVTETKENQRDVAEVEADVHPGFGVIRLRGEPSLVDRQRASVRLEPVRIVFELHLDPADSLAGQRQGTLCLHLPRRRVRRALEQRQRLLEQRQRRLPVLE